MFYRDRPAIFTLVSTDHGMMIASRLDFTQYQDGGFIPGTGLELLMKSHTSEDHLGLLCQLVNMRRESFGDGVICIDGGANFGVYTLELARMMLGWGRVLAFEPQRLPFYALAGNIVLNNLFNARAMWAALGKGNGVAKVPMVDPYKPLNYGGVPLDPYQPLDGTQIEGVREEVQVCTVDSFGLERLDLLKLDVEGMELEVLEGAQETIKRCKPVISAEHFICKKDKLDVVLHRLGYETHITAMDIIALHESDPLIKRIEWYGQAA